MLKNLYKNENPTNPNPIEGNAPVEMNTTDYSQKMRDILQKPYYKPIKRDPTTYLEHQIFKLNNH